MAEKNEAQSVSIEEFNTLKAKFDEQTKKLEEQNKAYSDLSEKTNKLKKIFDERQTKSLDHVLKELGFEKVPEKSDKEVITSKFSELETKLKQMQDELTAKDKAIALSAKKSKALEIAKNYNFVDTTDVLGAINFDNDDLEGQVKTLAENKKHWIKQGNVGGSFGKKQEDGSNLDDDFLKGFNSVN